MLRRAIDRLLLGQVLGREPGRHLLLDRGAVRPAEPGLLTGRADGNVGSRIDAVGARVPGVEHAPAALSRRRLGGAPLADGAPVGGDEIDRHADLLQQVGRHLAHGLERRLVLRHQAGDRLAGIAGFGEQLLGAFDVALALQRLATFFRVERRAGREEARDRLPQAGVVADHGAHVVFLAERHLHGAPHLHVVEGRVHVVHAERADVAERIGDVDLDVLVLLEHRHEIGDRRFPPVDLAVLQRRRGGGGIGHDHPLDAVDPHLLAAGEPGGRLVARLIVGELLEYRLGARHPFGARELHGSAADVLGDLLEGVGLGDPLRHDEGHRRAVLAEREQHLGIRRGQHPLDGAIVDGNELLLQGFEHQPHGIARCPARQAGDHVLGQHRLAVMELEAWAAA